jgi:hypothetical protein
MAGIAAAVLVWRNRKRSPACPGCGRPNTFVIPDRPYVCEHCGFDLVWDDY